MSPDVRGRSARFALRASGLLALAILWQLASGLGLIGVPGPLVVARTLVSLIVVGDPVLGKTLLEMLLLSLWVVVRGAAVGAVLGVLVGVAAGSSVRARIVLQPLVGVLQPIPPLAWLPLAYLVFSGVAQTTTWVQLLIVSLAVFFPVVGATVQGVAYTPPTYAMVGRTLGAGPGYLLLHVALPAALPSIMGGLRVGIGVGWMSIIAAEFVGGRAGIGFFIWNAYSIGGRADQIIAGVVAIGLAGLAMASLLLLAERRLTPWHSR